MKKKIIILMTILISSVNIVKADSITTQDVTWYYRNMTNESTMNNTVKTIDTYVNLVSNSSSNQEYLNGYTTRVSNSFTKDFQYNINYTLRMLYNSTNDGNFRSDTIERLKNYAYVDSDFTLINSTINQIKYSCEAGICTRIFSINISAKANVNTNAIRFGVYTSNNISLGFYNHYIGNGDVSSIRMILSETTNITENSNSVIIGQNETIINQNNQSIEQSQQNTQDIIDNSNSNTQAIIDSNKVCEIIDKNKIEIDNKKLNSNGTMTNSSAYGITSYIKVGQENYYYSPFGSAYFCWYDSAKTLISCIQNNSQTIGLLSPPSNAVYFRASIDTSNNKPQFKICNNGNQALNDSIEEQNKTSKGILGKLGDLFNFFNNDDVDNENTTDTLENLSNDLPTNSVISDLLLLPVTMLQSIVNSISGSCSSFNLGSLYGSNLVLPCINIQSYLGSTIWTFIDLVFSGTFILVIRKKFIQIFENITNLRNGGNEVE